MRHGFKFDHLDIRLGGHLVFICIQTHLLARTVVFSINHCVSFNVENLRVYYCPSRGISFLHDKLIILLQTANLKESVKK